MRKLLVLFSLLAFASATHAAEYHLGADVLSGHVFRGQEIGSAGTIGVQPHVGLVSGGFSVGVRAHGFIQDRDSLDVFDQASVTVAHAFSTDQAMFSVGVHQDFYADDNGEDTATEVFSSLRFPAPLSPKITVGYNFSNRPAWDYDWYISLSGSTRIRCIDVSASVGLSDADGSLDFHDANITASQKIDLPHFSLSPHVRLAYSGRDAYYWIFGLSVSR
ncbi:MAG: hypothetical protein F4Y39_24840 [Gemmatimonadetes bacterium]|nr:hypothetical protein [Gemmatimonadota bacterium]MYF79174.1 hypothetical protein [Chloroflexota bacterium]